MRGFERTRVPREKPLGARERTQATLVGGECSHHSITLAPQRFTVVKVIIGLWGPNRHQAKLTLLREGVFL